MVVAPRTHLSSDLVMPWGSETGCGLSERDLSALWPIVFRCRPPERSAEEAMALPAVGVLENGAGGAAAGKSEEWVVRTSEQRVGACLSVSLGISDSYQGVGVLIKGERSNHM